MRVTTIDLSTNMDDLDDVVDENDDIDDSRVCVIVKRMKTIRRFLWATA